VIVRGNASKWTGAEFFDIACDQGQRLILAAGLRQAGTGDWEYRAPFVLEAPASDLEFRIWVDEGSDLSVQEVELASVEPANGYERSGKEAVECGAEEHVDGDPLVSEHGAAKADQAKGRAASELDGAARIEPATEHQALSTGDEG